MFDKIYKAIYNYCGLQTSICDCIPPFLELFLTQKYCGRLFKSCMIGLTQGLKFVANFPTACLFINFEKIFKKSYRGSVEVFFTDVLK